MVDDVDAHNLPRLYQPPRQIHIVAARLWIARRVVVEQDDGSCGGGRGFAEDLPRVRRTRVERSDRDNRRSNQTVFRVEHHQAKLFDRPRSELRQQIQGRIVGSRELHARWRTSQQCPAAKLDRGQHLRRFRGPHP